MPNVDKECTTHHCCECIGERLRRYEEYGGPLIESQRERIKELRAALEHVTHQLIHIRPYLEIESDKRDCDKSLDIARAALGEKEKTVPIDPIQTRPCHAQPDARHPNMLRTVLDRMVRVAKHVLRHAKHGDNDTKRWNKDGTEDVLDCDCGLRGLEYTVKKAEEVMGNEQPDAPRCPSCKEGVLCEPTPKRVCNECNWHEPQKLKPNMPEARKLMKKYGAPIEEPDAGEDKSEEPGTYYWRQLAWETAKERNDLRRGLETVASRAKALMSSIVYRPPEDNEVVAARMKDLRQSLYEAGCELDKPDAGEDTMCTQEPEYTADDAKRLAAGLHHINIHCQKDIVDVEYLRDVIKRTYADELEQLHARPNAQAVFCNPQPENAAGGIIRPEPDAGEDKPSIKYPPPDTELAALGRENEEWARNFEFSNQRWKKDNDRLTAERNRLKDETTHAAIQNEALTRERDELKRRIGMANAQRDEAHKRSEQQHKTIAKYQALRAAAEAVLEHACQDCLREVNAFDWLRAAVERRKGENNA